MTVADPMRFRLRTLLICVTVVAVVLGLVVEVAFRNRRVCHYSVEIWHATQPRYGQEVLWWLRDQPGVIGQNSLHFDDHVIVEIRMQRDFMGRPPFPCLEEALPSIGYTVLQYDMKPIKEYHRYHPSQPPPLALSSP